MTVSASAQVSFTSAIDLALRNSPRVKMAQDDVNKATASLAASKSVFIPSLSGSIGAGPSYGITTSLPTIFTLNAQSLAFNFSQFDYIRAAHSGLQASNAALTDVREEVEEDTAITYVCLDRAQQRQAAMTEEYGYAVKLVSIVQDRLDAGMDTPMELKQAHRTAVQIRLQQLQLDDEIASLRDHLSQLTGLPADQLSTVSNYALTSPSVAVADSVPPSAYPDTPGLLSAEADAHAKQEQAIGDSRNELFETLPFRISYFVKLRIGPGIGLHAETDVVSLETTPDGFVVKRSEATARFRIVLRVYGSDALVRHLHRVVQRFRKLGKEFFVAKLVSMFEGMSAGAKLGRSAPRERRSAAE